MTFPHPSFSPKVTAVLPTISFTDSSAQSTNSSTHTFTGLSTGTAASSRYLVVGVVIGGVSMSSVKIDGNAMTQLQSSTRAYLYGLSYPTGTTGTIVVTTGSATFNCGLSVYALYDLTSTTPTDSNSLTTTSAGPNSVNLNTSAGGVVVAIAASSSGTNRTFTWSGITEDFDAITNSGNGTYSGAHAENVAAATPKSVSVTLSGAPSTSGSTVSVSFR